MGNSLGGRRTAKVMKIDGEKFKLKTPVRAGEVVKDYPGYVLLESEAVKQFGVRAKPLEPQQELKPRRLYFLLELPKFPSEKAPRKIGSGIHMSAKDRLECLMLSRRTMSDVSMMKPTSFVLDESEGGSKAGAVRVKMRLPKAQVAKLVEESKDESEVAEKIMNLCIANSGGDVDGFAQKGNDESLLLHQRTCGKNLAVANIRESLEKAEKRVSFLPEKEEEIRIEMSSQ